MNIFVMVDMEGISGIYCPEQVTDPGPMYQEGRRLMVGDVNACVRGCRAGGAKRVIVRDAHASARNFIYAELEEGAEYILGITGDRRMPGIEDCDGLILLGYHAMAGTPDAILEHSWSSKAWQNCWLNDRRVGEIGMDAAMAGDRGVPAIMVSGDDQACAEAASWIPGVVQAPVKTACHLYGGRFPSMKDAHALIEARAAEAVKQCRRIKPLRIPAPVRLRLELVERGQVPRAASKPYMRVIDGRTYEVEGANVEEALWRLG